MVKNENYPTFLDSFKEMNTEKINACILKYPYFLAPKIALYLTKNEKDQQSLHDLALHSYDRLVLKKILND